jgi:HD-GYP domain-containing protein (c-di-GMP phosphodiesterase class II)
MPTLRHGRTFARHRRAASAQALLSKRCALTEAEFEILKPHPHRGHAILPQSTDAGAEAMKVCLQFHVMTA